LFICFPHKSQINRISSLDFKSQGVTDTKNIYPISQIFKEKTEPKYKVFIPLKTRSLFKWLVRFKC
jgi:hypothetical protein